jgi:type II secretory pathway pseudopilin PulG
MDGSRSAFSLVEAILTVVIIGILAAIILPHFIKGGFVQDLTLRTATAQIASDIRYTRQLAITNSAPHSIIFNFSQKEYGIYRGTTPVGEIKKIPPEITYSGTSRFDFSSPGSCSFSGDGLLLNSTSSQYQIKVEPPTGVVVVEKAP